MIDTECVQTLIKALLVPQKQGNPWAQRSWSACMRDVRYIPVGN